MALDSKEQQIWNEIVRCENPYVGDNAQNAVEAAFDMRMVQFVLNGSYNALDPDITLLEQVMQEYMLDREQLADALEIAEMEREDG